MFYIKGNIYFNVIPIVRLYFHKFRKEEKAERKRIPMNCKKLLVEGGWEWYREILLQWHSPRLDNVRRWWSSQRRKRSRSNDRSACSPTGASRACGTSPPRNSRGVRGPGRTSAREPTQFVHKFFFLRIRIARQKDVYKRGRRIGLQDLIPWQCAQQSVWVCRPIGISRRARALGRTLRCRVVIRHVDVWLSCVCTCKHTHVMCAKKETITRCE
jgi:hypothetical protein